jgi:hypothetical protein
LAPCASGVDDEAGTDRVHADAIAGEFDRGRLAEADHRRFRGGIHERAAIAAQPAIDAVLMIEPPSSLFTHRARGVFDAEEHAFGEHVERVIPRFYSRFGERDRSRRRRRHC